MMELDSFGPCQDGSKKPTQLNLGPPIPVKTYPPVMKHGWNIPCDRQATEERI